MYAQFSIFRQRWPDTQDESLRTPEDQMDRLMFPMPTRIRLQAQDPDLWCIEMHRRLLKGWRHKMAQRREKSMERRCAVNTPAAVARGYQSGVVSNVWQA